MLAHRASDNRAGWTAVLIAMMLTFNPFYLVDCNDSIKHNLSPVILVPGAAASQLEAKLNKPSVLHMFCDKQSDYYSLWLNMELLLPGIIDCWVDNARLVYDNVTRETINSPGVTIRVPGWGNPIDVEWLDPSRNSAGKYFYDIANALVEIGYVRNVSIRGAPYDFRKDENVQFFLDLKLLVEETYTMNNKRRVTFIAHSMGSPMTLLFLQRQSDEWKVKHIERLITLAGVWAGSMKALQLYATGDNFGQWVIAGKELKLGEITFPSVAWLLPSSDAWKPDEVLVNTLGRNYSLASLEDFFNDIRYPNGWEMYKDQQLFRDLTPPGVEVHCILGSGVATVERLDYEKSPRLDDGTPTLIYGDGDGTVNARSLHACAHWFGMEQQKGRRVSVLELPKADHGSILRDARALQYIQETLI